MQRPSYWLMADPTANPQFRRGWLDPLGHKSRTRHPMAGGGATFGNMIKRWNAADVTEALTAEQARALAEVLFVGRRTA